MNVIIGICGGLMFGIMGGIVLTRRMIEVAITKADLCADDKRMIRDVLGIPQNGEGK